MEAKAAMEKAEATEARQAEMVSTISKLCTITLN
jgi:hypothetical protein